VRVAFSLIILLLSCIIANASSFYVATTGDDSNDCLTENTPCQTIQAAVAKIPIATVADIYIAAGIYADAVNAAHFRVVNVRGDCADPSRVIVQPIRDAGTAFWAQDYATLGVSCLTISSPHTGDIGIAARQFAIVDFQYVHFGAFPGGIHISIADLSVASCTGPYFMDNLATVHAAVSGLSRLTPSCPIYVTAPLAFTVFAQSAWKSFLNAGAATISGAGAGSMTTGIQWIAQDATIILPAGGFPGNAPGQTYDNATVR
jgi:hypothetical protein